MNKDEKNEIIKKREYLVVKGNELIQKNRFELKLTEQKTIAYICSMIKPIKFNDNANEISYQLDYEFNIRDYCKICGLNYDNGKNYADIKATLKRLSDRSMWVVFDDNPNEEVLCRWLSKVRFNKNSGIVNIRIDEDLAPYLFDLKQKFTQYPLQNILAMKSVFSVRIYELLKSYAYQRSQTFNINELKQLLMVDTVKSYKDFSLFRERVLETAIYEINKLTDLIISYEPIKKGNKVVKINFTIEQKTPMERLKLYRQLDNKLNK